MDEKTSVQVGGRILTWDEFTLMPPGTVVGTSNSRRTARYQWTKNRDHSWSSPYYGTVTAPEGTMNLTEFVVLRYPEGFEPSAPPAPTLLQYKWQFRDWALAAQEANGVDQHAVLSAMDILDCQWERFEVGAGLVVEAELHRGLLPDGAVVRVGRPEVVSRFGLFVKAGRQWNHLLGGRSGLRGAASVIESMPGRTESPAWLTEQGDESAAEAILAFKRRAWVVATKVQQRQQWCSTFNSAVARMGLSEDVLRVQRVGAFSLEDWVTPNQAGTLPVGTILRWTHHENTAHVAWYQRIDGAGNRAGTRRIFGYLNDGAMPLVSNYANRMEVMWLPGGVAMSLDVDIVMALPHLPPGTALTYGTDRYVVAPDNRINSAGSPGQRPGRWDVSSFGGEGATRLRVVEFPAREES